VLGIATHLVWDAFTHPFSWPWQRWVWMQGSIKLPGMRPIPTYETLQYGSTIIGLAALGIWVLLWYRRTAPTPSIAAANARSGPWIALTMVAVGTVAGLIRAWLTIGMPKNLNRADSFLLVFGVTTLALVFWEVLIYCVMISSRQTW
jgi:Domain of unknown function (DUF4184)